MRNGPVDKARQILADLLGGEKSAVPNATDIEQTVLAARTMKMYWMQFLEARREELTRLAGGEGSPVQQGEPPLEGGSAIADLDALFQETIGTDDGGDDG